MMAFKYGFDDREQSGDVIAVENTERLSELFGLRVDAFGDGRTRAPVV